MAMYNSARSDEHDDYDESRDGIGGSISRWWNNLRGRGAEEDYEVEPEAEPEPAATATMERPSLRTVQGGSYYSSRNGGSTYSSTGRRAETVRIAATREGSITVMPVTSFADIQKCADRLKSGEPQIVNLEKTPPEVAERLIDFLNGVTYALDGFVEKVSDGAYLFTPAHITIQTDGPESPAPKPFFDR